MGIFSKKPAGELLPEFLPSFCLGEQCPNFSGAACETSEMEWISADAPAKSRDTTKPPLKEEARFILYGQRCIEGAHPTLVSQRVEIYKPEEVNMMEIVAITGSYGEMPVEVVGPEARFSVETITSSD